VLEAATGMTAVWDDPRTWSVIGYLAIFPSLVSFLCFNRGVALIGANRASALLLMMPLVGVVLSMIFLGEALILAHVVGGMLIFAGLYIGRRKPA
jgi:drug/metabolite transporter (DMT)-like permease